MDFLFLAIVFLLILVFFYFLFQITIRFNKKNKEQTYILLLSIIIVFLCLILLNNFGIFNRSIKEFTVGKSSEPFYQESHSIDTQRKTKKNKLLEVCGLPENYNKTSHCFDDSTHHTCCMLGPEARKYADSSGNPIGTAAKKAYKNLKNKDAGDGDLTPWCTCFGSEVCSEYSKMFNDGTHIKFINNPGSKTDIVKKPSNNCEGHYKRDFNVRSHLTPGVPNSGNSGCTEQPKVGSVYDSNFTRDIV